MPTPELPRLSAYEESREEIARRQLERHGVRDAEVKLVRAAGDTASACEEVWFINRAGEQRVARFEPVWNNDRSRVLRHNLVIEDDGW